MSLGESLMTLENHSGSHLQGSAVQEHCVLLNMETLQTTHLMAWCHIPGDLNPQQHSHKNLSQKCDIFGHIVSYCGLFGCDIWYWHHSPTDRIRGLPNYFVDKINFYTFQMIVIMTM
jgi:hypothetical protein